MKANDREKTKKFAYYKDDAANRQPPAQAGRRLPLKLHPAVGGELEDNPLHFTPGKEQSTLKRQPMSHPLTFPFETPAQAYKMPPFPPSKLPLSEMNILSQREAWVWTISLNILHPLQ